jgi:hypothetical protein
LLLVLQMMGGRLERAVDEVADLVASRPAWMAGNPAEFNEKQLRLYKEYAAKEQAAIEERLKRKAVMVGGAHDCGFKCCLDGVAWTVLPCPQLCVFVEHYVAKELAVMQRSSTEGQSWWLAGLTWI